MLRIIGIGPGRLEHLTIAARKAIEKSDVIVGYKTYVKLLGSLVKGKEIIDSAMTQEITRAKQAIEKAKQGKEVSVISSGDAGIYGMAGLILELLTKKELDKIKVEVVPGISSSSSCASFLGAPIMHDFVTISLSDLLTDEGLIRKRIELAAKGDFVIVIYNPKSKKRVKPFTDAYNILMKHRSKDTPVGIVRNAYRDNQQVEITTLKEMLNSKIIDMFTTIIIGNSQSYVKGRYMITPRGYKLK